MNNRLPIKLDWKKISLISVLIFAVYRYCVILWQFKFFNFLVPPSPDLVAHLEMTDKYINGTAALGSYPPLLHIITAFFAKISGSESLDVFMFLAPFWIPLSIVVFYILVSKIFDYRTAFWSTLVFTLVSSNPLLNFGDAQYADILGYNLIGPFFVVLLVSLIKQFKAKKLILFILSFCLLLSAHSLSAVLLYVISFIAVAVYCLIVRKTDKEQLKNALIVLVVLCVGAVPFFILSKALFGPIVSKSISSIMSGEALIKNSTAAVLEYDSLSSLLSPFLEFIGFAGFGFLLLRISKGQSKFPALFVVVWILVAWVFSRSDIFVLPQRIFRGISLPLSIASGVMVLEMLALYRSTWYRIGFVAVFAYLAIINNVQISVPPFSSPDGIKNQVWYRDIDQTKYEYIINNIAKGDAIIANFSNPVLHYKLKRAGYKIIGFSKTMPDYESDEEKEGFVSKEISNSGAKYLFIGAMPQGVNPEVYFHQFINYNESTELLQKYQYSQDELIKQFTDGSKLICIDCDDS